MRSFDAGDNYYLHLYVERLGRGVNICLMLDISRSGITMSNYHIFNVLNNGIFVGGIDINASRTAFAGWGKIYRKTPPTPLNKKIFLYIL